MKNMKITMLMIAVVAVGAFSLPSVLSVGTGQHTFVNGTQVSCNKCHTDSGDKIMTELALSNVTMYNTLGTGIGVRIHALDGNGITSCKSCHALAAPTLGDHTGVLKKPSCSTCHGGVNAELLDTDEAHKALNTSVGNMGCIGCHTTVTVTGSPTYSYSANNTVPVAGLYIGNGLGP